MWIVALALRRPYTFVVVALLLLILGPIVIFRTPTDIFPNIDIPVVSILWNYTGLNSQDMSNRIVTLTERILTTTVDDIEHSESQSLNGIAVVKVFFQPHANIEKAIAQITAISQTQLRQLPPGTTPPLVITYNASTVPILQLALSGQKLSEQQLFDYGVNFIRTRLVTIPGAAIPYPVRRQAAAGAGGSRHQRACRRKACRRCDVVNAISAQNLILPSGNFQDRTVRIRRRPERQPANGCGVERPSHQTGGQHDHLHPRCGLRARRLPAANQHRAGGRAEGFAADHPEDRERFDPGHHFRDQGAAAANPGTASAGTARSSRWRTSRFSCAPPSTAWCGKA